MITRPKLITLAATQEIVITKAKSLFVSTSGGPATIDGHTLATGTSTPEWAAGGGDDIAATIVAGTGATVTIWTRYDAPR